MSVMCGCGESFMDYLFAFCDIECLYSYLTSISSVKINMMKRVGVSGHDEKLPMYLIIIKDLLNGLYSGDLLVNTWGLMRD